MRSGQKFPVGHDRLIQSGYRLLYSVCFNAKTSDVVLRFLRSCNDFFCRHISALPFLNAQNGCVLNQMTGLLKCVAIELKITASNNQVTQFGNMCKILLGAVQGVGIANDLSGTDMAGHYYSMTNQSYVGEMNGGTSRVHENSVGLLICKLLECLEFEIKTIERPKFDFFDNSLIQQLLQSCEISTATFGHAASPKLINIKRLDDILRGELNIVQSTIAAGQMQLILQEKEAVLKYALEINVQKNMCAATVKFLEAWGQVTEILFSVAPQFAISVEVKQGLIIEILQTVLTKVVSFEIMPELANLASSTVLQLLVNLRHCYTQQTATDAKGYAANSTSYSLINQTAVSASPKNNSLSLKYILKNIVDWILMSGAASQKLKSNLYTAMLNFMHIIKGTRNKNRVDLGNSELTYVSRLDKSMAVVSGADEADAANQTQMAVEVFTAVGDKIIDILCHDCTGGHDICKMLAFSCIDMLLDMDPMVNFINFISRRGYLAHIVDSLMKSDNQLCRVLENVPTNMKALYVYESTMAMLGRVASSHVGAGLVLEHKCLAVLSQMKVFDMHPDFQVSYSPR